MRAVLCSALDGIDALNLETVDDPQPGPGEVAIDVHAAGVNFPDLLAITGKYQFKPPLPFVPGGECAGVVSAIGDGVTRTAVGDAVIATGLFGAFGEKTVVAEKATMPKPPGMPFETAAGISITYATSYYALKQQARLAAGETLLVLGAAGGVGLAAVELGHAMGARVIAAASNETKLDAAVAAGADQRLCYADLTPKEIKEAIKALTDGKGVDVVYDPVGGPFSEAALRATAWNGRLLVVGFAAGEIPKIPLNLALLKGAHIIGVFWGSWIQRDPTASQENFADLAAMFDDGRLSPRITTFPLADYRQPLTQLAERRAVGKLVLTMKEAAS